MVIRVVLILLMVLSQSVAQGRGAEKEGDALTKSTQQELIESLDRIDNLLKDHNEKWNCPDGHWRSEGDCISLKDDETTFLILDTDAYDYAEWVYEPKKDITLHEIALILPLFTMCLSQQGVGTCGLMVEGLPKEAQRHFRKIN